MPEDMLGFLDKKNTFYNSHMIVYKFWKFFYFFFFPIGVIFLFLFLIFISNFLKMVEFKSLMKEIIFHFFMIIYPSMWLMIILFFLIMMMNVFSLVPSVFSLSSLPLMTLSMSFLMWLSGYLYSIITKYNNCVSHFLPQSSPMILSVILVWIEVISWLCRPLALSVRLMANITASHLLMFLCGSSVFLSKTYFIFPLLFLIVLAVLKVSVSFIQSYVYLLLLSLYMQEALV